MTPSELSVLDDVANRLRRALREVESLTDPQRVVGPEGESVLSCGPFRRAEAFHGERTGPLALVVRLCGMTWTESECRHLRDWLTEQLVRVDASRERRLSAAMAQLEAAQDAADGDRGQAGGE